MTTTVNWNKPDPAEADRAAALRKLRQQEGQIERMSEKLAAYSTAVVESQRFISEYLVQARGYPTLKQVRRELEALGVKKERLSPEQKQQIEQAKGYDHLRVLATRARDSIQVAHKA